MLTKAVYLIHTTLLLMTSVTSIPLKDFYPYGSENGDEELGQFLCSGCNVNGYGPTQNDVMKVGLLF